MIKEIGSNIEKKATEAFRILKINNKKVKVKLDTGAEVNVMPLTVYEQIQSKDVKMKMTATKLCVYRGANLRTAWRKQELSKKLMNQKNGSTHW